MQEIHADKVLMIAIGNNDYISYNKLFDRYYGRLCQYVYSLLMDRNDAEDVQRCRREVYQRIKTYYFYPMKIINWKQKSLGSLFMIV